MGKIDEAHDVKKLDSRFQEFIAKHVRTPRQQTDIAKQRWREVVAHLETALGENFDSAFLAGSYARKVQVRRLKDVDVILVLNDPDERFRKDALASLQHVKDLLSDFPGVLGTPEIGVRAVTLYFTDVEFKIDVVPALAADHDRHWLAMNVPEEGKNEWSLASPKRQNRAATRKNEQLDGNYTPATQLVKEWNQSFGEDKLKAMPSYLAESILYHAVDRWSGYEKTVVAFFRAAVVHLGSPRPSVPCPGDEDNFVDERLEDARRLRALTLAEKALRDSEAALAETDPELSIELWASVFTAPDFPAAKNDPAKFADALGTGGISVSGAAVTDRRSGRKVVDARSWRA